MRGTKTVIERMESSERIEQTDKELIELTRLRTENQSLRTQLAEKEAECACMREALSKAITLSKAGSRKQGFGLARPNLKP